MEREAQHNLSNRIKPLLKDSKRRPCRWKRGGPKLGEFVKSIMNVAFEPLLLLDSNLRIIAANHLFRQLFRPFLRDIEGQALYEVADHRLDFPNLEDFLRELLEEEATVERSEMESDIPLEGGRRVRVAASRLNGEPDCAPMVLLAFNDVTDQPGAKDRLRRESTSHGRSGEALREQEEKFRVLVETMNDGLAMRDENGLISYVNDKICNMLGYSRDEVVGRPVTDFLDEGSQVVFREQMVRRQKGEQTPYEVNLKHKNGHKVYALVSPKPVFDALRRPKGSFAVITDITERKAMENALRNSQVKLRLISSHLLNAGEMERERLARELHDELGQDLAVLKYQTRFIENGLHKNQQALKEACADAIEHLETIMGSVRRISRDLSPTILRSYGLTASIRKLAEDVIKHDDLEVTLELDVIDHLLSQEAEVNLYRILQEALTNVRKHARATHVSIAVTKMDGSISVRIADDGRGFDPPNHAGADSEPRGLGLAIIEERSRMIRAPIVIKSTIGAGTEILLHVPVGTKGTA
jgi:PAS domain S-box-containing protein